MNLESLYQDLILDHYKNPLNKGLAPNPTVSVHHVNPSCGDEITLNLAMDGGRLKSVTWDGVGCSISQASTSVMSDLVQGNSVDDALKSLNTFTELMQNKGGNVAGDEDLGDGIAFIGVAKYPARIKCALLGWMALKDALMQAESKVQE
jgi:nitrogen fixation protein NifU and related proteins